MRDTGTILRAPIFLLGSHKSGSSLLRSLLDGHSQLFAFPSETHFFQRAGYWIDYRLRLSAPKEMDRDSLIASLSDLVAFQNVHQDKYADSIVAGRFNIAAFRTSMEKTAFDTPVGALEAYFCALHVALMGGNLSSDIRIVEKSVENAEYAVLLRHIFPDCVFLHIVRNPYASLVAIRKARARRGFPFLGDAVCSLRNSYYNLYRNQQILHRYLQISYEDLVTCTERTMRKVSTFLGIEFSRSLLTPTLLGAPWRGNSTSNQGFTGVSSVPLNRWRDAIHPLEIELINRTLAHVLDCFGYDRIPSSRRYLLPAMGEGPITYSRNRSFLWMC